MQSGVGNYYYYYRRITGLYYYVARTVALPVDGLCSTVELGVVAVATYSVVLSVCVSIHWSRP